MNKDFSALKLLIANVIDREDVNTVTEEDFVNSISNIREKKVTADVEISDRLMLKIFVILGIITNDDDMISTPSKAMSYFSEGAVPSIFTTVESLEDVSALKELFAELCIKSRKFPISVA